MKALVITNMYPDEQNQVFGVFIKETVDNLKKIGVKSKVIYAKGFLKYTRIFLKTLFASDFDLIHAHYVFPCGLFGVIKKKISGKKLIITAHGDDIHTLPKQSAIIRYFTGVALRNADQIIAVGNDLKKDIIKNYGVKNVSVIPCGINTAMFKPMNKKICRNKLGLGKEKIVLFAGYLIDEKNPLAFVDTARKMKDRTFIMIGDGDLRSEIENNKPDNLILVGYKPHNELPLWYNAADCLMMTSRREGFGLVLAEALACKLPVICSGVGGNKDIITNNETGLMTIDYVAAIKKLDNTSVAKKLAENGYKKIIKNYSWNNISKQIKGACIKSSSS